MIVLLIFAIVQLLLYRLGDYYKLRKGQLIVTLFFILGNFVFFPMVAMWIRRNEHDEYGLGMLAVFGLFWILGNITTLLTLAIYVYGKRILNRWHQL